MFRNHRKLILFLFSILFSLSFAANAEPLGALFHRSSDPVGGNPNGKVTVVEFFDYQCSHCVSMAPIMDSVIKSNPELRVVYKEFPIRGPMSEFASRAALAANKQGKYAAFNHALLTTNQPVTEDTVFAIAKSQGLDVKKFKRDMNSKTVKNQIKSNLQLAQDLNLSGTPAFFIGKTDAKNTSSVAYVLGEMSQGELQAAIDKVSK